LQDLRFIFKWIKCLASEFKGTSTIYTLHAIKWFTKRDVTKTLVNLSISNRNLIQRVFAVTSIEKSEKMNFHEFNYH
jgi:hypothetical protein